jgi:hypothetical protein
MIDTETTNNIMPLSVMEALGMGCTKYYETKDVIYAIDSRKVLAYGEIKYFYVWINFSPHITIVFTITVVDLPLAYGVVLRRDWSALIGGYIMNDESCMMLPNKDGTMLRVPREPRKPLSFKKNDHELMEGYVDDGIGSYVMMDSEQLDIPKPKEEKCFEGLWRMSFDGVCCSSGSGVGIIFKILKGVIHPHVIRLEFPCTNNEVEYEALIQGMTLALQMKIEHLIIISNFELVINHIMKKYKIQK